MIIWIIGVLFTIGLKYKADQKFEFLDMVVIMLIWPMLAGEAFRVAFKTPTMKEDRL